MDKKGLFIVFEGIDGSGKDTHIELLAERLQKFGFDVVKTYEPWESSEARMLKRIAADGHREISADEEADLYLIDRYKHSEKVIKPSLEAGKIVICNRYYYSTMAYQGALGADPEKIKEDNESVVPMPDLVLMLKTGAEEGLRRIEARGKGIAKGYEQLKYLKKVAEIMYNIKAPNIQMIDTERPRDAVAGDILIECRKAIGQWAE
jgi:dTMP kinase